jgi:uncharacterized protein
MCAGSGRAQLRGRCAGTAYRRAETRLGELPVFASATYLCKGHEATPLTAAYFHSDPPAVLLRFQNQQAIAFAAPSGSGARYSAEGVEIWEHQGVARFTWQGEEMECPKR